MQQRTFYVYILTNQLRTVLYTGVTNNREERILQHYSQRGIKTSFTGRYSAYFLLFYEPHSYIENAIAKEKEIKGWSREKKMQLITNFNPTLTFLNYELYGKWPPDL